LLLIDCFLGHRCIHENIHGILQHNPLLCGVAQYWLTVLVLFCLGIYLLDQGLGQGDVGLDYLGQHSAVSMEVGSVPIGGLAVIALGLGTESGGRHNHSAHEELLTAHRVRKRLAVSVYTAKK
jgi:hypothetical protein